MIPYWITYRPDLDNTPAGSLVVLPDNNALDAVDGAMLTQRGLGAIVYTGCNNDAMADPSTYADYLGRLRQKLRVTRRLTTRREDGIALVDRAHRHAVVVIRVDVSR